MQLSVFISIYDSTAQRPHDIIVSHIWPIDENFSKHSILSKCLNRFYLTFLSNVLDENEFLLSKV